MEHAGVAITITTFTDLVSFTIASFSTKIFFVRLFLFSTNKMKRWCHCLFLEPFATMRSSAWPLSTSTCAPSSSPPSPTTRRGLRLAGGLSQYDMILRSWCRDSFCCCLKPDNPDQGCSCFPSDFTFPARFKIMRYQQGMSE